MPSVTLTLPEAMRHAFTAFNEGKHAEAAELCGAVVAVAPDVFEAVYLLAVLHSALGRHEEALAGFERALELRPDVTAALNHRGNTMQALRRFPEALASYDRALAIAPDYPEAHNNRGFALYRLKRFAPALESYDKALALRPDFAEALSNRGIALAELRRFEEALASYERAKAVAPDYVQAHINEALLRLLTGDLRRGFAAYEWRWRNPAVAVPPRNLPQPEWHGAEPIAGRTILLYGEQGFGDDIQFCRYVPLLAERGARVILEVAAPLRGLMTSLAGAHRVVSSGEASVACDLHCSLLGLPLAFGTTAETIPAATPYLHAPAQTVARWASRLGTLPRPRIGLVWAGNPHHDRDDERSIALRALLPLLQAGASFDGGSFLGASFVSLQKDLRNGDAATLAQHPGLLALGGALTDFADTAALISQLDLVISVDTSVAHLAGALGKPVFVLLPFTPDWRWQLDRDDSPWYPTARLFRQTATRAWDNVVARAGAALAQFVGNRA